MFYIPIGIRTLVLPYLKELQTQVRLDVLLKLITALAFRFQFSIVHFQLSVVRRCFINWILVSLPMLAFFFDFRV